MSAPEAPARRLTTFDLTCIGVNAIVGSGIFTLPGRVAKDLGPASILAFFLCGVLCIPLAYGFARAASRHESSGATYLYAREAFGSHAGFAIGWLAWTTSVVSWAAVAVALAPFVNRFLPEALALHPRVLAVGVIVGLGVLNVVGVRPSAILTDGLTVVKLLPLLVLLILGLVLFQPAKLVPFAPHGTTDTLRALGPAMFVALFAYQGFEVVAIPAGEARAAPVAASRAVLIAFAVPMALYTGLMAVAVMHTPSLATSKTPLVDAAAAMGGATFASIVGLGAVISIFGFNAGTALTAPRYLSAMAEAGQVPTVLARLHPRFGTPYGAIIVTCLATAILAATLDFDRLVDLSNVSVLTQYLVTMAALIRFILFVRDGEVKLKMPLGITFPLIGAAVSIYLLSQSQWSEQRVALVIVAGGLILSEAIRRRRRFTSR